MLLYYTIQEKQITFSNCARPRFHSFSAGHLLLCCCSCCCCCCWFPFSTTSADHPTKSAQSRDGQLRECVWQLSKKASRSHADTHKVEIILIKYISFFLEPNIPHQRTESKWHFSTSLTIYFVLKAQSLHRHFRPVTRDCVWTRVTKSGADDTRPSLFGHRKNTSVCCCCFFLGV